MTSSKREDNSTDDNCTSHLKVFRIPQITDGDCEPINAVVAQIFSDLYYILTFTAIAVNIIKIVSTARRTQNWSTSHLYLVNVAVAHIIFLLSCPVWGIYLNQKYDWHLGKYACSLMNFTNALGHFGSVVFICVICVDRMVTIYFPLISIQYKNVKFGKIIVMASWALSLVIASLGYAYTTFKVYGRSKHVCGSMHVDDVLNITTVWSFILFLFPNILIPTIALVPCYVKIMIYLLCQKTRLPCDMGRAVILDITYTSSFLILCLSSGYAALIICFVYLTSTVCHSECTWANIINVSTETARLMNVFNALIGPLIYLSKFRSSPCTSLCDCSNLKLCSCECSHQPPPSEGIQTVQLVYISCHADDRNDLKIHTNR
ncbi:C-C chemokine receptor type 5-like [Anomaloglossus baeobatrachus]|uniref:C-C chemokine receptor type 5-like n=1 Tax=Anomaloglossus baeobatrachus TaxID=238106 RepID=UPI003F5025AB